MFDIGFWELLLIGIVTLVVVGPERLPEVARSAGVYIAKLRRFVAGVKSDINAELETGELKQLLGDQKDQIRELKDMVDTTRREMETSASNTVKSVKEFSTSVEGSYKSMGSETSDSSSTTAESGEASNESSVADSAIDSAVDSAVDPVSEPVANAAPEEMTENRILPATQTATDSAKFSSDTSVPDVSDNPVDGQGSNG